MLLALAQPCATVDQPAVLVTTGFLYYYYTDGAAIGLENMPLAPVALIHTLAAFALIAFMFAHIYLTTTGRTPLSNLKAMVHGWEDIVSKVAGVARSLPAGEREGLAILAPDYGIAGAIDFFGPEQGLPPASSGHNNYWWWGPSGGDDAMIVIGGSRERLENRCGEVHRALESLDCGLCMPYEDRRPVWICRDMKAPLSELWPRLRHYD